MVGVTRETISRIETGAELPAPATADKLLAILGKEWGVIGVEGIAENHRPFHANERGKWLVAMGESLKRGREKEGLKLREVARACHLSMAQLSRIERGQITRSRVILEKREHKDQPFGDRAVWFKDEELIRLEEVGRRIERAKVSNEDNQLELFL